MKYPILIFCFLCMVLLPVAAQQYKTELPYRMVGGKMIVEMNLNGTLRSFIFDTGASRTTLTGEVCRELGLTASDSLPVTDANGKKAFYPLVYVESIRTPDNVFEFKKNLVMIIPEPSPLACFQVDGLIGSDLFAKLMLIIDGKRKVITIQTAEKESAVSLRAMRPFVKAGMPIVSLPMGSGHNIVCLFDTGSPRFLSLKKTDFAALQAGAAFEFLSEGVRTGAISVGGLAAADTVQRVNIPLLSVGVAKFRNVIAETATPPFTLLGVKLLDYGKVVIDYPRGRFYFEAYKPVNEFLDESHDVSLTVKEGELVIGAVWGKMKSEVEMGDKVIKINGKPVGKHDFCESIINGIPELKAKKKTKLTVLTRQGEKVIIY